MIKVIVAWMLKTALNDAVGMVLKGIEDVLGKTDPDLVDQVKGWIKGLVDGLHQHTVSHPDWSKIGPYPLRSWMPSASDIPPSEPDGAGSPGAASPSGPPGAAGLSE